MDTYAMDLIGRRRRRRQSTQFKEAVIQEGMRYGVSMAAAALAHSPNTNMLRKWVIDADAEHVLPSKPKTEPPLHEAPMPGPTFVPLALPAGKRPAIPS